MTSAAPLEIRPLLHATSVSVAAINRLLPQLSETARPITLSDLECTLRQQNIHLLTCVDMDIPRDRPEHIIGMGVVFFKNMLTGEVAWIYDIVVDEKHRRRGAGMSIVQALIDVVQKQATALQKPITLALTSNDGRDDANKLYRKLGFKKRAGAWKWSPDKDPSTNYYEMRIMPQMQPSVSI